MWHTESLKRFVAKRDLSPETKNGILARLDETAQLDGMFLAGRLSEIMGSDELAREFEAAMETDLELRVE